jgi:molybdopterin-guanine dinucleotide biosynthesis protein A
MTLRRADAGAVVLAGGGSRRMGRPKALLDWHGSTLVERVAGLLARVAAPVVIVAAPGQQLPDVPGAETAVDANPGRGPLEGIAAGLRALQGRCDRAFVAATDLPLMHPAFASAVLDALEEGDAAAPESGGRVHPLAAAYRISRLELAEHLLAAGELRASALAQGSGTRVLPAAELPHPESLRNVNTPDDYRTLLGLPEPMVVVDGAKWRAATLGRLQEQLGSSAVLSLDGLRVDHPTTPLAEGDELTTA